MLRIRRGSPGRDQTMPHADLVASNCIGIENASAFLICFSTYAAPSTCLRNFRPCSKSLSLIEIPPELSRSEFFAVVRSSAAAATKELSFFYPRDATMACGHPPWPREEREEETGRSAHE